MDFVSEKCARILNLLVAQIFQTSELSLQLVQGMWMDLVYRMFAQDSPLLGVRINLILSPSLKHVQLNSAQLNDFTKLKEGGIIKLPTLMLSQLIQTLRLRF